jgi:hypothetical protein
VSKLHFEDVIYIIGRYLYDDWINETVAVGGWDTINDANMNGQPGERILSPYMYYAYNVRDVAECSSSLINNTNVMLVPRNLGGKSGDILKSGSNIDWIRRTPL